MPDNSPIPLLINPTITKLRVWMDFIRQFESSYRLLDIERTGHGSREEQHDSDMQSNNEARDFGYYEITDTIVDGAYT